MKDSQNKIIVSDAVAVQKKIYTIRGEQVMLDSDLAVFYEVETRRLNEQVKRNIARFPAEFMFQLTKDETENLISQSVISKNIFLRSQNAILKKKRGMHSKYLPFAFTEQGVVMLSGVLRSETEVNISFKIKGKTNRFSLYNMNSSFCVS